MDLRLNEVIKHSGLLKSEIAKFVYPDKDPVWAGQILSRELKGGHPTYTRLERYAHILGVEVDDLMQRNDWRMGLDNKSITFNNGQSIATLNLENYVLRVMRKNDTLVNVTTVDKNLPISKLLEILNQFN